MKKLLQINVTANWGSTGKIAEDIGILAINSGWESFIGYGRKDADSSSYLIKIGDSKDQKIHGLQSRILDNHGLASKNATKNFIEEIKFIQPDVIHLHNIHGYYINYPILFNFLKEWGGPVVWTLHDCWPFTGHCAHYTYVKCDRWKNKCGFCPQTSNYPASLLFDRSVKNLQDKKDAFLGLPNLTLVPVSDWLAGEVKQSFLRDYPVKVIKNGINLNVFKPIPNIKNPDNQKLILGVSSVWPDRKGLKDFIKLRNFLPEEYKIKLVGLSPNQIKSLPSGIEGVSRTENINQLVEIYNLATVFVNPTLEDTYPTTNLEAIASGTPVITYKTGGSPEAVDDKTGIVTEPGNVLELADKIKFVCENNPFSPEDCRKRAEELFDKNKNFQQYLGLYGFLT